MSFVIISLTWAKICMNLKSNSTFYTEEEGGGREGRKERLFLQLNCYTTK